MFSNEYMVRTMREWGECLERQLAVLGLQPPGGSRVAEMLAPFQKAEEIQPGDKRFPAAREAMRDLRMMGFALEQLAGYIPDAVLRDKVRRAMKDPISPVGRRESNPGRDTQCELYVAAICKRAGLSPQFAEPDIICRLGDTRYGLAVKRLQSVDRFQERFRKCCDQIDKSGLPGYAVMDLSLAANPENIPVTIPVEDRRFDTFVAGWCHKEFGSRFQWMKEAMRGREVRGVIVLTHFIQYKEGPKSWGLRSFTWLLDLSPDNMRRTREFKAFSAEFEKGLPTGPSTPL
ncbi:MAG: hypothetical protein MUP47_05030 [Phycisphaerae bacterium]|nr:hypothetical protein [Phycisphaerae bacterium]